LDGDKKEKEGTKGENSIKSKLDSINRQMKNYNSKKKTASTDF